MEAIKNGIKTLVQCKHWRTWEIKENIVRELPGSMTDLGVRSGAIYTLKGWTGPAAVLAEKHGIVLVDGLQLASRAKQSLAPDVLDRVLDASVHHCPKCEGPMVFRTGGFSPFWGCARYPACNGKLKYTGARWPKLADQ